MVVSLQPFFNTIYSCFVGKSQKNTLKTTFYLNVTETKTLLEDTKIELPSKREIEIFYVNWYCHIVINDSLVRNCHILMYFTEFWLLP